MLMIEESGLILMLPCPQIIIVTLGQAWSVQLKIVPALTHPDLCQCENSTERGIFEENAQTPCTMTKQQSVRIGGSIENV